jgi:hypothetical protein
MIDEQTDISKITRKSPNDIRPLKNIRQLETLQLDMNSPRWQKACKTLGFTNKNFMTVQKQIAEESKSNDDISELRKKHFQNKLIEIINRVLAERKRIKIEEYRQVMANYVPAKKVQKSTRLSTIDPTFITSAGIPEPSTSLSKKASLIASPSCKLNIL